MGGPPQSEQGPGAQSWPAFDSSGTHLNGGPAPPAVPGVKLTPLAILRALRRRWLVATSLGLLLGSLAGVMLWFVRPAQFTAYALLKISPGQVRVLPESGGQASGEELNYQKTQVAIIKSRQVIKAALRNPAALQTELIRIQPDPVAWLEGEMQVAFVEGSDIARIALTGRIPADLATLVNAVKDAYLDEVVKGERNKQLVLYNEVEKISTSLEDKILTKRENLRKLAETLKTSDSAALTLKQKIALEEYAALQKELATISSQLRSLQTKLVVQKASVQSPDHMVVPPSLVDSELDHDTGIAKQMLEVQQLEELIEKRKGYFINNVDPSSKTRSTCRGQTGPCQAPRGAPRCHREANPAKAARPSGTPGRSTGRRESGTGKTKERLRARGQSQVPGCRADR